MGWWSSTDADGNSVDYKQSVDTKDGSYRSEKLTHYPDGSHSHEVVKVSTSDGSGGSGGIFSWFRSGNRES